MSSSLPSTLFIIEIFLKMLSIFKPQIFDAKIAINKFLICIDPYRLIFNLKILFLYLISNI